MGGPCVFIRGTSGNIGDDPLIHLFLLSSSPLQVAGLKKVPNRLHLRYHFKKLQPLILLVKRSLFKWTFPDFPVDDIRKG